MNNLDKSKQYVNIRNPSHKKFGHLICSAVCEGEEEEEDDDDDEKRISKSMIVDETAATAAPPAPIPSFR